MLEMDASSMNSATAFAAPLSNDWPAGWTFYCPVVLNSLCITVKELKKLVENNTNVFLIF